MNGKRKLYAEFNQSDEDGVIKRGFKEFTIESEPGFYKMYKLSPRLLLPLDGSLIKVFLLFLVHSNSKNEIKLIDVVEDGALCRSYIMTRIPKLIELNFLLKIKPGRYQINPQMFCQTNYKKALELIETKKSK